MLSRIWFSFCLIALCTCCLYTIANLCNAVRLGNVDNFLDYSFIVALTGLCGILVYRILNEMD